MSNDSAIQAEAEGKKTVTVQWRDLTPFDVPIHYADMSFEAALAASNEDEPALLAALLPGAVLAEFRGMGVTVSDARDLLAEISKARGFASMGESTASSS